MNWKKRQYGHFQIEENGQHIPVNIVGIGLRMFHETLFYDIPKKMIGYWINSSEAERH